MKKLFVLTLLCGTLSSPVLALPEDDHQESIRELYQSDENQELDSYGKWPTLGDGDDSSNAVRAAQYLLRADGYTISVDGVYGAQTRRVVEKFQQKHKLTETSEEFGQIETLTWETLIKTARRGSKGSHVRAVQSLLRAKKYKVALDGNFGSQTVQAVKAFQKSRGLTVNGVVGGDTWCELVGGEAY